MNQDETMQLPVDYQALLAKQREDMASRLSAPTGDFIRIGQDKSFTFPDGEVSGQPFEAIIIDFQYYNLLFAGPFVRNGANRVICFANGGSPKTMVPSDESPEKQAPACGACPNNQFGSATNGGAGKACANRMLLALLRPGDADDAPLSILNVPPVSQDRHFQKYMRTLIQTVKKNPIEIVTRIGFDPNSTYASPVFEPAWKIEGTRKQFVENPNLAACMGRIDEARARLESERPDTTDRTPQATAAVGRTRR